MKVDPRQIQAELDEDKALKEDLNNIEQFGTDNPTIEQLMADASVDNYIDENLSFKFEKDDTRDWYFENDCRNEPIEDDYYDTW